MIAYHDSISWYNDIIVTVGCARTQKQAKRSGGWPFIKPLLKVTRVV